MVAVNSGVSDPVKLVKFTLPEKARFALRGDAEFPAVFVGNTTRLIKTDGSLGSEYPTSFNDFPASFEEVKKRFSELTRGGFELVLSQ